MADRQEFRFVIDGLELSDEQTQRVSAAVYKAAVGALAGLDLRDGSASVFVGPRGGLKFPWAGGWWGDISQLDQGIDGFREIVLRERGPR